MRKDLSTPQPVSSKFSELTNLGSNSVEQNELNNTVKKDYSYYKNVFRNENMKYMQSKKKNSTFEIEKLLHE